MLVKILFLVLLFFNNKYCFAIDIDKEKSKATPDRFRL